MTPLEAEAILKEYIATIKDLRPNGIVQSTNALKRTTGLIKYAHFVYGEHVVKEKILDDDLLQVLTESFGFIHIHFVENPENINLNYREYISALGKGVITDFVLPNPFGEPLAVLEFFNFIGECMARNRLGDLEHVTLGAYIFEGVRRKATEDKDINTLRKLTSTAITRAISLT